MRQKINLESKNQIQNTTKKFLKAKDSSKKILLLLIQDIMPNKLMNQFICSLKTWMKNNKAKVCRTNSVNCVRRAPGTCRRRVTTVTLLWTKAEIISLSKLMLHRAGQVPDKGSKVKRFSQVQTLPMLVQIYNTFVQIIYLQRMNLKIMKLSISNIKRLKNCYLPKIKKWKIN